MSLRDLAKRVHVSPSLISQIETGKSRPSVGTLYALTSALHLSLDKLFAGPELDGNAAMPGEWRQSERYEADGFGLVVRSTNRKAIDLDGGVRWERLTSSNHPDLDFLYVIYAVGGSSSGSMTRHAGREFGILLKGTLGVTVNFDDYLLGPGDSITFAATTPHRLWNAGNDVVEAVWCVIGRHRSNTGAPT